MADLEHVLWIGGPAGAGKTTAARLLARRHGLRWYNSDTRTWEHRDRALAAGYQLPPRGPGSDHYDRRPMIVDDLRALPRTPLIVAEGGPIHPEMVTLGGAAVWLLPSPEVQRERLARRHPDGIPTGYLRTYEKVLADLAAGTVPTLVIDGLSVSETVDELSRRFTDRLAAGPTAAGIDARRALIREGNRALVAQYTSPRAVPLVPGDPGTSIRTFDCECAAPDCIALVCLAVRDAAVAVDRDPPAILAAEHS